jgi:hypothetical protein
VGEPKGEKLRDAIYDFFDDRTNNPNDTLLFYYSGHGVPGLPGDDTLHHLTQTHIDRTEEVFLLKNLERGWKIPLHGL